MKKNISPNISKRVAKLALEISKINVNSFCCFGLYQPKLPNGTKMLKNYK